MFNVTLEKGDITHTTISLINHRLCSYYKLTYEKNCLES